MKDIFHKVDLDETGFVCADCEMALPDDPCYAALSNGLPTVIEVGGTILPVIEFDPFTMVQCKAAAAKAARELAAELLKEGVDIGIAPKDEPTEYFPPKIEIEKKAARGSFNNFLALREAFKPEGMDQ